MDVIWGIDISSYQGEVNFPLVATEKQFTLIKVGEGVTGIPDSQFQRNRIESRKTSLGRGYYQLVRPDGGYTPEQEADFLTAYVDDLQKGELLILDLEPDFLPSNPPEYCLRFFEQIKKKYPGYKALLYTNRATLWAYDWSSVIQADHGLWVSTLDGNTDIPSTPWPNVAINQYSQTGQCAGINVKVDEDVFYGDLETFKKYGYQPAQPEPPVPTCEQKLVEANKEINDLHVELQVANKKLDDIKLIVNS